MSFYESVAKYARIDDPNEDVQGYIDMAEGYLLNAGIETDESDPVYALAVKMLVSFWYDNPVPKGEAKPQTRGIDGIILQLQLKKPL